MGFFSWITQDTKVSIANVHSSQPTSIVTMTDNKGRKWIEPAYDGYGIFGGKDYYELLAEMNGRKTREKGIELELGVHGIMRLKDSHIILGNGHAFFNWQEDIVAEGKSANKLVAEGKWKSIRVQERNIEYPNLTHDTKWEWVNNKPNMCPYQGFFY